MVARMTSRELTTWTALFAVHGEEAERQKDLAESGDGTVIAHGRPDEWGDDEDDEPDDGD